MNHTLFHFRFKKQVEKRSGPLFDVSAGFPIKAVKLPDKLVKCEICNNLFAGKRYLDIHVRFKHPSQDLKLSQSSSRTAISSKTQDKCVNQTTQQQVVDESRETT